MRECMHDNLYSEVCNDQTNRKPLPALARNL